MSTQPRADDSFRRANGSGGSLRARWLGEQLRKLRQDRGLTLRHVAAIAGVDYTDVKDHENGLRALHQRQIARLLDLYQVQDPRDNGRLLQLARDGDDTLGLDPSLLDHLWLEAQATRIRCHSTILLPGLLQTLEYAAATRSGRDRTDRHQILDRLSGGLHAVVEESVLHRTVGGAKVLRHQLRHLAEASRAPNVHVQVRVLPTRNGRHDGTAGSFTVFDLPGPYPPVVAAVHRPDTTTVHEGRPARRYAATFDHLARTALDPTSSADLIAGLAAQTP